MKDIKALVLLLIAMVGAGLSGCDPVAPHAGGEKARVHPATPAPPIVVHTADFPVLSLPTLTGKIYELAGQRGKWVVVNFWATWCSPCLREMPDLSDLHKRRRDVAVVGVAYEDITPEALSAFLAEHPVSYPIVLADPYQPPGDFATPRGLPSTFLIAPDGRMVKHVMGPVTAEQLEQWIDEADPPVA